MIALLDEYPHYLMAVHTLNTITGAIDVPGGVLIARPAPLDRPDEPNQHGSGGQRPSRTVEELAATVLDSGESPIDVCIVHQADPVFTSVAGERGIALARVELD